MKEMRTVFFACFWFFETIWLAHCIMVRAIRFGWGWLNSFRETARCPRGHRTPVYGVYECRCRAVVEGWVFSKCRVCRQSAGWTPCLRCGLPVRNPLL